MSIDTCAVCDAYVDTDDDCECYVEIKPLHHICLCEPCREKREEEYEAENGPRDKGDAWTGGFARNH